MYLQYNTDMIQVLMAIYIGDLCSKHLMELSSDDHHMMIWQINIICSGYSLQNYCESCVLCNPVGSNDMKSSSLSPSILRGDSYSFCLFGLEFYGQSLWYRLDQCTAYFLYWLLDDKIAPYSTPHIIQCWIHRILSVRIHYKYMHIDKDHFNMIDRRIWNQMDKRGMNAP